MVKWNGIPFLEISSFPLPWVPQPHEPLKSLYLSFVPSPFSVTCCLTHTLCPFLEEAPREDPVASARPQRPELRLSPRPRDPGARPRGTLLPRSPSLTCRSRLGCSASSGLLVGTAPTSLRRLEWKCQPQRSAGHSPQECKTRTKKRALRRLSPRLQQRKSLEGFPNTSTNCHVGT